LDGSAKSQLYSKIRVIDPVGYLDMLALEQHARLVLTDSGGMQKEAYFFGVPCITLRPETEWIETVEEGWNVVVGSDRSSIVEKARTLQPPPQSQRQIFGNGHASELIVRALENTVQAMQ
jgi:UDP-GlcNAc3NAcA epimerase